MKKRLLSIALMLVMVLSLVACGSKAATPKDVLVAMSGAEVGSAQYTMDFVIGENTVNVKMDLSQKDEMNGMFTVSAKFNIPESGYAIEEFTPVTEMYVVNGTEVYLNVGQIMDFLVEMDSQFAMIEAYLGLTSDYLMISYEDLIDLYESMGMDPAELGLTMPTEADANLMELSQNAMIEIIGDFLNEYATNAGESVIVAKDNKITFTMTPENMATVVEAMSKIDVEAYVKNLGAKLDEIYGTDEYTTMLTTDLEGTNDALKQAAEDAKAGIEPDGFEKMTVAMGLNGKNIELTMDVTGKESTASDAGDVKINMVMTTTPDKAKEITVPTEYMDIYDIIEIVNALAGSMY